jgi:hypothetical protein
VRSLYSAADRAALLERVARLRGECAPRWGRMDVGQMVHHVSGNLRMARGELATQPRNKRLFQTFPVKHLVLFVLPFPKNVPTAPELVVSSPCDFEEELAQLRTLIALFAHKPLDERGPVHPVFGPLTHREWGILQYRHTDHHLSQFGV